MFLLFRFYRFLLTHIVGTCFLAAIGVFLVAGGGLCLAFARTEEAPTQISVADFEANGPGETKWVEVTDGYLFWPRAVELYKVDNVTKKEDPRDFYVPLVSKAVLARWMAVFAANVDHPDEAVYPFDDCRVVVKLSPAELEKTFPGGSLLDNKTPDELFVQHTAAGGLGAYAAEDAKMRKIMETRAENLKSERLLVLEQGVPPPTKESFLCTMLVGLPFLLPLGILLLRRRSAARAASGGRPAAL